MIEKIYDYQFKPNCVKIDKPFPLFYVNFWNIYEISIVLKKKKNETHRSIISEVINSEICVSLDA